MTTRTGPIKPHRTLALLVVLLLVACVGTTVVRSQDVERKVIKRVEAKYPDILRKKNIGGTVRLKAVVKADGSVKSVEVVGGNPILAEAARAALMQWRFATGGGESTVDVAMNFDPSAN